MSNYFKHKMRGKSPGEIAGMIIFGTIFITGLAILFGFVIMWLWNWLMPMIFGLTTLTFWEAVGVFILFKILLGGCGGFGGKDKKSSKKANCKPNSKGEFSKWKHYDNFWKEEGNIAYETYVNRITNEEKSND
ncbi:hypothetical protein [Psychroserpens ponticola]|uniref:Uncharacterized protein n=1 Tax=Psychroserpens ponticola TaxID=2932268 RepID=A0ABY7RW10_9FLAO|nr:hypothetical protein [Psychroserpens ponticola]WCO00947.1 hypothetical protein MUN68_012820 [Psychroserpens ponticola]